MYRCPAQAVLLLLIPRGPVEPAEDALREEASRALRKAVAFFRGEVSTEGGYLWRYSADLAAREGEVAATPTQVWVQPPGTPAVGMALLEAFEATGERSCLEAARDAARCLARGQRARGEWDPPWKRRRPARGPPPVGPCPALTGLDLELDRNAPVPADHFADPPH